MMESDNFIKLNNLIEIKRIVENKRLSAFINTFVTIETIHRF